jgi:DNA-binding CsgD family transcriptional regulator
MGMSMESFQQMKLERDLHNEFEKVKQHLRHKEKDLFVAETRISNEIKEKKQAHEQIARLEKDLGKMAQELEENKIALKVLLEQRQHEKTEFEDRVAYNLKEFTLPYIERLLKRTLDSDSRIYLEIIETNINKVMRPLIHTMIPQRADLTPTEIKVATLIGEGKKSKEISNLLFISLSGVEYHRNNIREKLGIKKQNINLRKYLASLIKTDISAINASIFHHNDTSARVCPVDFRGKREVESV